MRLSGPLRRKQSAAGKLTILVFGTLAAAALYSAYHILPFYYYYYELQNQFESHAKAADMFTNRQLHEKLMYHIRKMQIPINSPADLKIERNGNKIKISLAYSEVFYVTFQGKDHIIHTFDFTARAEDTIK